MIRLCEITGLTYADMVELTAFFFGLSAAGAFAGNVLFWMLQEFLEMAESLVGLLFKLFVSKRKGKKASNASDSLP